MDEKIYVLIKHENLIDIDNVEIVISTTDLNKVKAKFEQLATEYENMYLLTMKNYTYASFTNDNDEYLIELMIEELELD